MRISVFGLGYVGAVCSACIARAGHDVIGVDVSREKVERINACESPIVERDLPELIAGAVTAGRLRATTDAHRAVMETEVSFVCVGTPGDEDGDTNLDFVRRVCREIGESIARKQDFHVVVMRSTVPPGTLRSVVIPQLEAASGRNAGADFGVAGNPEFLREGTAVRDFHHPPVTVIGEHDARSAEILASLYEGLDAPLLRVPPEAAEMVKYASNAWHAAKVVFANEIGSLCKELGVDGSVVMDAFCQDRKLNISTAYLRPGFAFGGSCLPKDVRALCRRAELLGLDLPLLRSLLESNARQVERALALVEAQPGRRVGLLGLTFKPETDDLRESPLVELARRLMELGYDLRILDPNVSMERIDGANRAYLLEKLPDVKRLLATGMEEVLQHSDIVIGGHGGKAFADVPGCMREDQVFIDLARRSPG